ncbi:MAG: hypothetical protein LBT89_10145 [Planctomycetaceae bacterium]|jgi:hypothetical protein|nr:hypothetical protein [Planctomycetaceae bacterium]
MNGVMRYFNILFAGLVLCSSAAANTEPLTEKEHPWGLFDPGSMTIMQTSVTFRSAEGAVMSIQKMETTLVSTGNDGITLQEAESIEMGSRTVAKEPQIKRYDFWQELISDGVRIKAGTPVKLIIDKRTVPCEVRIYEQDVPGGTKTTTVWWSLHFFPHVLRTERVLRSVPATDAAPGTPGEVVSQSVTAVLDISGSRSKRSYKLQTTERSGQITKQTEMVCSRNIPGGILSASARETDGSGKEIRSSITYLTRYKYKTSP